MPFRACSVFFKTLLGLLEVIVLFTTEGSPFGAQNQHDIPLKK